MGVLRGEPFVYAVCLLRICLQGLLPPMGLLRGEQLRRLWCMQFALKDVLSEYHLGSDDAFRSMRESDCHLRQSVCLL